MYQIEKEVIKFKMALDGIKTVIKFQGMAIRELQGIVTKLEKELLKVEKG